MATARRTSARAPSKAAATTGSAASAAGADAKRKPRSRAAAAAATTAADDDDEEEDDELLKRVSEDARKLTKRKRGGGGTTILAEFASLDALLDGDAAAQRKKQARARKLQQLRAASLGGGDGDDPQLLPAASAGPLGQLMSAMESNMTSLSADDYLFERAEANQEKFGYVFAPMAAPLVYKRFEATPSELASDLGAVYKAMEATSDAELGALLWHKAILLRCMLGAKQKQQQQQEQQASQDERAAAVAVRLPARICSWLFTTMATHSNSHIVRGCLSNLFMALGPEHLTTAEFQAGLPSAAFCQPIEDYRALFGPAMARLEMEWEPSVYDFLNAFRSFGFQDSKRSMSTKSKLEATAAPSQSKKQKQRAEKALPFPTLNMQYVLMYLVICLRARVLALDGYDAFSFTMFFLRMQFEADLHPEVVQLASLCIEQLLEVFPSLEWRKEWAPSLVLRIAGAHEGLFDSAAGWLAVARRLPRTIRGTQLTTGLCIYVLQHRLDKEPQPHASSERPLKFPIQSGLVLDIVAGIVEDLTVKYTEKKLREGGKATKTPATASPLDLLCKKVALMDLALQAFLNILTQKEMAILLQKLDALTGSHKSTMSAKWHELKTLVSLMHRKYSLENLRIGREASPPPKSTLFPDLGSD